MDKALLVGDATQARTRLGWQPQIDFPSLVKMMVDHDVVQLCDTKLRRSA
jgi:GDPmannose 4,6-dehydratase